MHRSISDLVAYLSGLPDDWESWLVYADVLAEQGDERGQLLVREQRGEPIGELADAWMGEWSDLLPERDLECYRRLREVQPIASARTTPPDLVRVLAQPLSQLLALLEPSDDEREGASPVLARHEARLIDATIAWIDRAFDGVRVPDEAHRTLHQAQAADNYETCDRSRDHVGRWQDLPDAHLLDNQWALPHLDEQGIHYYLPAAMCFALRHLAQPHARDVWITESLSYTVQPSGANLRDYQQRRFALLDRTQRAAIHGFAAVTGNGVATTAWGRVIAAEQTGARDDWFALYSPL